jgi:hypothetical protein
VCRERLLLDLTGEVGQPLDLVCDVGARRSVTGLVTVGAAVRSVTAYFVPCRR